MVVTPRRWLDQCNPELSALISRTLKVDKSVWLKELPRLEELLPLTEDAAFREEWAAIKQRNKERLAHHVQTTLGLTINTKAMFDVQIKRLHEYKRQTLNILGVIHVRVFSFARVFGAGADGVRLDSGTSR
jgi:starch phosphorylase